MFGPFRDELEFFRLLEDKYHSGADVSDDFHITEVFLRELLTQEDFEFLTMLPQLKAVRVFHDDYTDNHLQRLPMSLMCLSSFSSTISLAAIAEFCRKRSVKELHIGHFANDSKDTENWRFLRELHSLEDLAVECDSLPSAFFQNASLAPKLRKLEIQNVKLLSEDTFDFANRESSLKELRFLETPSIKRIRISGLSRLMQLDSLDFACCGDVAECLRDLEFPVLTRLSVTDEFFTASAIEVLNYPMLKSLILNHCKVTDADFKRFSRHPSLREINVVGTSVTVAAIETTVQQNQKLIIWGPEDFDERSAGRHHKDWDPKYLEE